MIWKRYGWLYEGATKSAVLRLDDLIASTPSRVRAGYLRSADPAPTECQGSERLDQAKRMMGLEPTTFCMESRRSSQLSYIREHGQYSQRSARLT